MRRRKMIKYNRRHFIRSFDEKISPLPQQSKKNINFVSYIFKNSIKSCIFDRFLLKRGNFYTFNFIF
jgi:hypothetical protein